MDADVLKLVEHEVADLRTDVTNFSCEIETEREQLKNKLEDVVKRLQNEIEKFKTRVDNVEHVVKRVHTDVKRVDTDVKRVDTDIKRVDMDVKRVDTDVKRVDTDVKRVDTDVKRVDTDVKRVDTDVKRVDTDVKRVDTDVKRVDTEVKRVDTDVKGVNCDVKEFKEKMEHDVKEIREKMDNFCVSWGETNVSSPNHFIGVPNRNTYFTGRKVELIQLHYLFQGFKASSGVEEMTGAKHQLLAISGLGGCGKTATAIEYAWLTRSFYTGGIFWLSGESDEMLSKSVDALIGLLGDVIGNKEEQDKRAEDTQKDKQDVKGLRQKLSRVLLWLHKRSLPWLMIVDDTDHTELSPSMSELLRGSWIRDSRGHVLVTSRCKPEELREVLQLQPTNIVSLHSLTDVESVEFLKKRINASPNGEELQDLLSLADELGGLPLALEQAAVYINVVHCTVNEYLEEYRDQRLRLLRERKANPISEYNSPERLAIQTTWQVNIEHISKAGDGSGLGEAAVLMMKIAAFLSPDIIPVEVVNAGKPEVADKNFCRFARTTIGQKQIVDLLTKFSLFEKNQEMNSLSVHRLVQEVIREGCAQDGTRDFVLSCAVKVLHKAFCDTFTGSELVCWWDSFEKLSAKKTKIEPALLPSPSTGGLWIKLAMNSNCLRKSLVKHASSANAKILWLTKENARLLRETALYFSHFRNFFESRNCHKAMLRILGALNEAPPPDELDKLTRNICLNAPCTDNFSCQYGTWNTLLKSTNHLAVEAEERFLAAEKQIKTEVVAATGQAATIAFGRGNYSQCCTLIDQVVSRYLDVTVDKSARTSCKKNICSDRSASLTKFEKFEEALADVAKWLECCPGLFIAHYRKVYILCKLAEDNLQCWKARARAAMAVFLYRFGEDGKAVELRNKFPQILVNIKFIEVANTNDWQSLDNKYNEILKASQPTDDSETVYIFTGGEYQFEKVVRSRGCFSFVGLPGQTVKISVKCGILLSSFDSQNSLTECTFVLENLQFSAPRHGILCCGCALEVTNCSFEQIKSCGGDDLIKRAVQYIAISVNELRQRDKEHMQSAFEDYGSLLMVFEMKCLHVSHSLFIGLTNVPSKDQCGAIQTYTLNTTLRNSSVILQGNTITNFNYFGIDIKQCDSVSVSVLSNISVGCFGGISRQGFGTTTVSSNRLLFHVTGLRFDDSRDIQVSQNSIMHSYGHCVVISNSSGKVYNNQIVFSGCWGLVATSGSNLQVEHNNISGNGCGGVRVFLNDGGHVTLQDNVFQNAGPSVCPVNEPPLLEQQVITGCDLENEEVKKFLLYGKQFLCLTPETDISSTASFNPPKLINNVQNDHSTANQQQETALFDFCSKCSSRLEENFFICETCLLSKYCGKQCCLSHLEHRRVCKSLLSSYTIEFGCRQETRHTVCSDKLVVVRLRKNIYPFFSEGQMQQAVRIEGVTELIIISSRLIHPLDKVQLQHLSDVVGRKGGLCICKI